MPRVSVIPPSNDFDFCSCCIVNIISMVYWMLLDQSSEHNAFAHKQSKRIGCYFHNPLNTMHLLTTRQNVVFYTWKKKKGIFHWPFLYIFLKSCCSQYNTIGSQLHVLICILKLTNLSHTIYLKLQYDDWVL